MAKLYFKYGAMGSSKTANALMTKFNYEEKGNKVWLIKPAIDTRDDVCGDDGVVHTIIKSRIGLSAEATVIHDGDDIVAMFEKEQADAVIVDECQFMSEEAINALKYLAEFKDVAVLCYGLRSDFQTKLFPGSKRLFEIADSISEIKSICKCDSGKKAIVNARFNNGRVVIDGDQIDIGGNEKYEGMCWKCWKEQIDIAKNT